MKRVMRLLTAFVVTFAAVVSLAGQAQPPSQERNFLNRIRRLTVEGKRAGEGYWSPDGKRLVFQSEREAGNPFYQIYVLDLSSGETKRISPGLGKTTCAFFRPNSTEIDVRVDASRSELEEATSRTSSTSARRARSAATRGTTTRRWTSSPTTRRRARSSS